MTAVGKILVFINLLFSLLVGAFIVMAYVARTNWAEGFNKLKDQHAAAQAEAATWRQDAEATRAKLNQEITTLQNKMKEKDEALAGKDVQVKALNDQLTAARDAVVKGDAGSTAGLEAVKRHEEEVKRLLDQMKVLNTRITASLEEQNKLRDRALAHEIDNKAFKVRNKQLAERIEELDKKNIQLQTAGANAGSTSTLTQKNPPLENIEGVVMKTDSTSGLLTLSIGSDAGLTKGHTLEVYRLSPSGKYLGTLRIVEVTPHQAIARPMGRPATPIQQGDRVASKILGS